VTDYEKGYRDGIEAAAELVRLTPSLVRPYIAQQIRSLAPAQGVEPAPPAEPKKSKGCGTSDCGSGVCEHDDPGQFRAAPPAEQRCPGCGGRGAVDGMGMSIPLGQTMLPARMFTCSECGGTGHTHCFAPRKFA